jgi:glycosyltransferase involved in cell wall biosynthesis
MTEGRTANQMVNRPFILHVGGRRRYKNFETLLNAYISNTKINQVYDLVVIDRKPWYKDEIELIKESNLNPQIHLMQNVSDQDLVRYYQQARVFVYPSRYEGFGIPLLEAAACGTPVIANSSSSLVEIGENAVLYFSAPDEQSSLSSQLEKICFDDTLRLEYSKRSLEQSAKFSWSRFVRQFNELTLTL